MKRNEGRGPEEEMVDLHRRAEKQAVLKPASLFLLNNFISVRIHLLNYIPRSNIVWNENEEMI